MTTPATAAEPFTFDVDLHRRLHEPGPIVTITKAQAAWLLERISRADTDLVAALGRAEAAAPYRTALAALVAAVGDPEGVNVGSSMDPVSAFVPDDHEAFDDALAAARRLIEEGS